MPVADPATQEPQAPLRTVQREGSEFCLRELGQPVALPLNREHYPDGILRLRVAVGEGACRLTVDRGTVQVDGRTLRQGESCAVLGGADVRWSDEAGVRLDDPRRTDVPNGAG